MKCVTCGWEHHAIRAGRLVRVHEGGCWLCGVRRETETYHEERWHDLFDRQESFESSLRGLAAENQILRRENMRLRRELKK